VKVDEETAMRQAIVTPRGVNKYKKLAQGVKIAPGELQKVMHQLLTQLKNRYSSIF
jgi:hypothetical protein